MRSLSGRLDLTGFEYLRMNVARTSGEVSVIEQEPVWLLSWLEGYSATPNSFSSQPFEQ